MPSNHGKARSADDWFRLDGGPSAAQRAENRERDRRAESDRVQCLPGMERTEAPRRAETLPWGRGKARQGGLF